MTQPTQSTNEQEIANFLRAELSGLQLNSLAKIAVFYATVTDPHLRTVIDRYVSQVAPAEWASIRAMRARITAASQGAPLLIGTNGASINTKLPESEWSFTVKFARNAKVDGIPTQFKLRGNGREHARERLKVMLAEQFGVFEGDISSIKATMPRVSRSFEYATSVEGE